MSCVVFVNGEMSGGEQSDDQGEKGVVRQFLTSSDKEWRGVSSYSDCLTNSVLG